MILWLTCTHGRYRCLQRNLRCYLDQVTNESSVMFICNSGAPLKLPNDMILPAGKEIYIDNCSLMNFQSVGEKYQHAITLAMQLYPDIQIVTSADDDDIFLPAHLSEGRFGVNKAHLQDKRAYKPQRSWFRYRDQDGLLHIDLQENTLEPSIFVDADWVIEQGYAPLSIKYHQQWLDPLIQQDKILVDKDGLSTLIYNWGDNSPGPDSWNIYKMSGSGVDNHNNFLAHSRSSKDMGYGILYPTDDNIEYYRLSS